jgi:hypothetical protein
MKLTITLLVALLITACGNSGNDESGASMASEIDFCSCVNEPLNTDARVKACNDMMNAMTPAENVTKSMACREKLAVPDDGPDLCFCLRTTSRDEELLAACEAIVPEDMSPRELANTIAECAQ